VKTKTCFVRGTDTLNVDCFTACRLWPISARLWSVLERRGLCKMIGCTSSILCYHRAKITAICVNWVMLSYVLVLRFTMIKVDTISNPQVLFHLFFRWDIVDHSRFSDKLSKWEVWHRGIWE